MNDILVGNSNPYWFVFAALAILALYLLLSIPRRLAQRSSILGTPADAATRLTLRLQDQVDRAELGILELRQEFEARSRNETQLLQALIVEAEDRLEELRILVKFLAHRSASQIQSWPALLEQTDSMEEGFPELGLTAEQVSVLHRLLGPDDPPAS